MAQPSGGMEALMLHFPLHVLPPGLLPHQASAAAAVDHLKRRQIGGVIVEGGKAPGWQQLEHAAFGITAHRMECALRLVPAGAMAARRLAD